MESRLRSASWLRRWAVFALALASAGCATVSPAKKELDDEGKAALMVEAAIGALKENDPTGALQILVKAEEVDRKNPGVSHVRALALFAKRDVAGALEAARKAAEMAPKSAEYQNTVGRLLIESGRLKEAEAPLVRAAQDPLYRDAYKSKINLGILHYKLGGWEKSRAYLDSAIQDAPNHACVAYYYRGHLGLRDGKLGQALKDYDAASRKMCTHFADAHLALGIAYERNRQYDKARKKFLDIQQIFPDTPVADKAMDRLRYLP